MPVQFQFIGSNSPSCGVETDWTILCEESSDVLIQSFDETRGCRVDLDEQRRRASEQKFGCLGLKITGIGASLGYDEEEADWASTSRVRMWEIRCE